MKLTQIRNATNRLEYAGTTFLIDPWLAPKHTLSFVDIPGMPYHIPDPVKENQPMPFYDLPFPVEQIMEDVDAVIVTHLHPDHIDISPIDGTVGAPLDKKIQIYCQNEEDAAVLEKSGFSRITVLPLTGLKVGNAKITRIPAQHGTYKNCGEAMGVMFSAETEKTFYLAGDTVWYYGVQKAINTFKVDKKIKLATYASRCIENEILMYLRRNSKTKTEVSIDEPLNVDWEGNELLLSDILGTENDIITKDIENKVDRELLQDAMQKLSGRERRIVEMRFGILPETEEKTQKEVADILGISQSYISRLEKKIMRRLKKEISKMM